MKKFNNIKFDFEIFIYFYLKTTTLLRHQTNLLKICKSRCTLHCSSNTILDCKRYILRILLKILISEDENLKNFYLY